MHINIQNHWWPIGFILLVVGLFILIFHRNSNYFVQNGVIQNPSLEPSKIVLPTTSQLVPSNETQNIPTPITQPLKVDNRYLPADVYPKQATYKYSYGRKDYLLYLRPSLNFDIAGESSTQSGILYANPGDSSWKKFLTIKDTTLSKNNAYVLDYQEGTLYFLIVDTNGAGSGEGVAKLISINPVTHEWQTDICFYYSGLVWNFGQTDSLNSAITKYLNMHPDYEFFSRSSRYQNTNQEKYCSDFQVNFQ